MIKIILTYLFVFILYIIYFKSNFVVVLTDFLVCKYFDDPTEHHINLQILDLNNI